MAKIDIPKLGLGIKDAVAASSVGRNTLLAAVKSGQLPAAFIGAEDSKRRRIVIRAADLDAWLESRAQAK